jgi:hypothetical protein
MLLQKKRLPLFLQFFLLSLNDYDNLLTELPLKSPEALFLQCFGAEIALKSQDCVKMLCNLNKTAL